MKNLANLLSLLFLFSALYLPGQEDFSFREIENNAFKAGEKLKYKVYYESLLTGQVVAGIGELEVKNSNRRFHGRDVYHIIGTGKSNRTFDFFFKVRDRFESFVDKNGIFPHHFIRRTREGGYVKDDDVYFDHKNLTAKSSYDTTKISQYIQDIVSAVYYARTFSADTLKVGDNLSVNFFLDDSAYVSVIQYRGKEIVETELGVFRCLTFKPMVVTGEIFSNPYPMTLWITDDENKVPILAKSAVIVGSIAMELISFSGLKNPVDAKLTRRETKR